MAACADTMLLAPIERPHYADVRREARSLYWRGWGLREICDELERLGLKCEETGKPIPYQTIASWKKREKWELAPPLRAAEESVLVRYQQLVAKEDKSGKDFKEIDLLGRQIERFERCRKYRDSGNEADLNHKVANRNAKPKKAARANQITAEQAALLKEKFEEENFGFQDGWWKAAHHRTRFILKSRQIGATWYFAREALIDALETGRNQIFLSASRRQAEIFRSYIIEFVFKWTGVTLKGEHLLIDRGDDEEGQPLERPKLFFLGANFRTAQGEHGNFYYDECFWAQDFERIDEVASGMASQKRYRETYFSTPSTTSHGAYRKWSCEWWNEGKPKTDWTKIEAYNPEQLAEGVLCDDGIWRQRVTIEDAAKAGCDLFDVEELRQRKAPEVFANLYLCEFVDETDSAFPMGVLNPCRIDSFSKWRDYDPYSLRPYGEGEVAIGYDPQESSQGDDAALVVVALPKTVGGVFRVLETKRLRGDYETQAAEIFAAMDRYNVVDIGIDTTGAGSGVVQLVRKRFAGVRSIQYSAPLKTLMVLKAKNVMRNKRLQFDAGNKDISASFLSIRPELTAKGRQLTYVASRSGETGHADVAWAIMHVLFDEPLDGEAKKQSVVEFC
ncbi:MULTISPECIES: terminase large subunit domain-containing protein [unclassified Erythrobacter]|uniref:terminase large subunit domain-containing protein n=1 Tax=unclassified Erythrobacter TaxID=2633097 RepID=UPI0009EF60CE|nr:MULTISPECIES: terminase family protein [unclassified Erythrobacter]